MISWVESPEQVDVGFVLSTIPEGPIKIQIEQKKRSTGVRDQWEKHGLSLWLNG